MKNKARINISQEEITRFCEKHHIKKLSLFGSVLTDDFRQASDIDVLVEFEEGFAIGLLEMAGMELELSEILKRKVDLRTLSELSRYFRQEVLESSEVQYAKQ